VYWFYSDDKINKSIWQRGLEVIRDIISYEIKIKAKQILKVGVLPESLKNFLKLISQRFSGDITIWPQPKLIDLKECFGFPTPKRLERCFYEGSYRTYPSKLS
jgi:hypothetical protein